MATARHWLLARARETNAFERTCHALGALSIASSIALVGCERGVEAERSASVEPPPAPSTTPTATPTDALVRRDTAALDARPTPASEPAAEEPGVCPAGMVWVHGDYCPSVEQRCLEHHPEYLMRRHDPTVSERCLRYAEPTRCLGPRRHLSYCMDRFEYPNRPGELPRVLTSWLEARELCAAAGKRLCDEDEFNFACEGPDMLPYATGYHRDPEACNIDRPYRQPNHSRRMKTYDHCPVDTWCAAELARLDQRHRIGERVTCVSWSGVVDLNGNVNEWVVRPGQRPPNRSGLKGGWWGPVRNRCRPTVGFHKENDYGYEAGFRCCRDSAVPLPPEAQKTPPR